MTPQERRNRKLRAQQAEAAMAAIENAANQGRDYYKRFPNLMLIEVSRQGYELFEDSPRTIAFLRGYSEARIHHDDYKRGG